MLGQKAQKPRKSQTLKLYASLNLVLAGHFQYCRTLLQIGTCSSILVLDPEGPTILRSSHLGVSQDDAFIIF